MKKIFVMLLTALLTLNIGINALADGQFFSMADKNEWTDELGKWHYGKQSEQGSPNPKFDKNCQCGKHRFHDVLEDDWYNMYIADLYVKGIVQGNPDDTYEPNRELFADELIALVLRANGNEQENAEGYWAQNFINKAKSLNLFDNGDFSKYDAPITREMIAKIIIRGLGNQTYSNLSAAEKKLNDISSAKEKDYIVKAVDLGIITGYEDGTFRPDTYATRAEAATMVCRMIDESYRFKMYGNVAYSPKVHVYDNGMVTVEKVKEFLMPALDGFYIYNNNGKIAVRGDFSKVVLPENYRLSARVQFSSKEYYSSVRKYSEYEKNISTTEVGEYAVPTDKAFDITYNIDSSYYADGIRVYVYMERTDISSVYNYGELYISKNYNFDVEKYSRDGFHVSSNFFPSDLNSKSFPFSEVEGIFGL